MAGGKVPEKWRYVMGSGSEEEVRETHSLLEGQKPRVGWTLGNEGEESNSLEVPPLGHLED